MREVNLTELATGEGISENALSAEIRNEPGFPVLERGSNCVPYRFDLDKVRAYRHAKKEARQTAEAARCAQLQLWRAEVYGEEDEDAPAVTPAERRALAEAVKIEGYNRLRRGELVEKGPLVGALREVFGQLQSDLRQLTPDFARQADLNWAERVALDSMVRHRVNAAIARVQELLREERGQIRRIASTCGSFLAKKQ